MSTHYHKLEATELTTNYRKALRKVKAIEPAPTGQQVLVKNEVAGINASDVNMIAGRYFAGVKPPFDLGFEFAGTVEAVGEEVAHLEPGAAVMGIRPGGGFREYVTMDAATLIPVPAPSPELMALLTVGLAASIGLRVVGEMGSEEKVLVTAAAGGVGHLAVQLAKQAGNVVIGTCGSDEKADLLRGLGCDRVINYRNEDVDRVLTEEFADGIDLVLENVGGPLFDTCVKHLARRGRVVVSGFVGEYVDGAVSVDAPRIYHQLLWKSASVRAFLFSDYPEHIQTHLEKLIGQVASGELQVQIDPTPFRGLDAVADAMDHLFARRNRGKVTVRL
ncbi:MAG: zinc-binding dehydrogenase [Catalinimonas sp.]